MGFANKGAGAPGTRWVALLMAGTCLATSAAIGLAHAQTPQPARAATAASVRDVNIPAQSLASALVAFSRQTRIQIFADQALVAGKNAPAVTGALAPSAALNQLLAGSSLSYRFKGANTVTIVGPVSANGNQGTPAADGSLVLDTIDISGKGDRNAASGAGYQGTPDWVYQAPAAVSVISREAIQNAPSRNARDLLDNVAGVYANRAEAQNPGIAVNIRGLQDNDRIVMMIDGARQSFQRGGHGVTQRTYVDTAFVRAVDVEKSSTSGVGSLGSLGGSVNFRTIIADDLIKPGEKFGGEVNLATGTNGFNFDGSVAAAARISDSFSILAGISHKNVGPYEIGKNGSITNHDTTATGNTLLFSGQKVVSGIVKAEAKPTDDTKLTLGWVRNNSKFSTGYYDYLLSNGGLAETRQTIVNDTFTAAFDWKPDTDLIDFKAKLYYNHIKNDDWGVVIGGQPRNYKMGTLGGSIENTSRFDARLGRLSFNYGAEAFRDDANSTVPSYIVNGVDMAQFWNGGTPGGKRDVAGGFANAKLEHNDWLTVEGGLRYDWYHTRGSTTIYGNQKAIYHPPSNCIYQIAGVCYVYGTPGRWETIPPQPHEVKIDRSEGAFLPTFTVAVKPFDWLQPFVKYSKSFRPPTVMESFLASGHTNDGINTWAPNPYLRPERGDTWEVGANISQNGLFKSNDTLRMKVVGFYREVEDYIALDLLWNEDTQRQYRSPVNIDKARIKGAEVEANYDARSWYIGGTLTYNKTDWSPFYTSTGRDGPVRGRIGATTAVIFVQPEIRYAIDAGVRLFDEKLTVGGKMTHVGETKPTIGTLQNNYKLPAYTLYDLYASYAFDEKTKLRVAVTNLTDKAYISALGADYYAMPGRTATVSLNVKF